MKNEVKFKELFTLVCELYDKKVSATLAGIYWETLKPFTDDQCERAFKEAMLTLKFFPKPVDLLEILRGKAEDRATLAWIKVIEAVRRIGHYQSVQFGDPVIHSVFKFWGGWSVTVNGDWDESNLKWKQKEFEKLYATMSQDNNHPRYLPGKCEIDNAARGFDIKSEIIKIGFENEKRQISEKSIVSG
ncbi:MAG: DUF6475 domain-containing protein [Deltaproteobacteria bacterium]|nr:DUF6475 domain-containing protein [Deltaproteobacteria bacterium]